ncbi:MAG: hypothetical protein M9933_08580 [Chitinophagaceae bacterium]|nr:hypothetical protein [Chitinophagaceae bacterium]
MNKIIALVLPLFLSAVAVDAQITQGDWMVGGDFSYSRSRSSGNDAVNSTSGTVNIGINAGYFFYDRIVAGVHLNTILRKEKVADAERAYIQNTYSAGPFMRYYFLDVENRVNLFADAGALYLVEASGPGGWDKSRLQSVSYSVSVGTVVFLNTSVGVECLLAYDNTNVLKFDTGSKVFQFKVGLQIHLGKE